MADVDVLDRKRGSIKYKLDILEKFVKKLEDLLSAQNSLESWDIIELEHRIAQNQGLLDIFDENQTQLEAIVEASKLEAQFAERADFEESFYGTMARAKHILATHTQNVEIVSDKSVKLEHAVNVSELKNIKLPTIHLPKFNGEMETWLEFRDTFQSLIHKNEMINDIQKFHYLRAALSGEAANVIGSLEFVSTNYNIAWEILCERYNNTRLLIRNHIKALFEINVIARESSTQLRQLIDTLNKHLRALNILKQPTGEWDTLLIYLISSKLDKLTVREWEQDNKTNEVPTLENLKQFLKSRADLLETLEQGKANTNQQKNANRQVTNRQSPKSFFTKNPSCVVCKKEHYIQNCPEFLKLTAHQRIAKVKELKLCHNCLRPGHFTKDCRSGFCQTCKFKHNSLLHIEKESVQTASNSSSDNEVVTLSARINNNPQILLSTAVVLVLDKLNKYHTARVLLDTGSQSNFISSEFCDKLQLTKNKVNLNVGGLNDTKSVIEYKCLVKIKSQRTQFNKTVSCLVLSEITGNLPNFSVKRQELQIPPHLKLADPQFDKPDKIDMLLGAEVFWDLTCIGQIKLAQGPTLQKTLLGWIISGPMYTRVKECKLQCNFSQNINLENQLAKFWQIEECPSNRPLSAEEKACEEHFTRNTSRDKFGHFVVSLPFKESISLLGESKTFATKRFLTLERKLSKNDQLRNQYTNFIHEYEGLGHMQRVCDEQNQFGYYMPHHGVFKEDSTTTKLRVVFDASAVTSSGYSLNELQMVGPTIQQDLLSILLRFRKYPFVLSADIEKMYRQVLIKPEECSLQRILWRDDPKKPIDTYELKTVTYGTAAAAFLAIRCLYQLGLDVENSCPNTARVIKEDFYVDDLLTGCDSVDEAINLAQSLKDILEKGGFNLRKWVTNDSNISQCVEESDNVSSVKLGEREHTKTLGLIWDSKSDNLTFNININISPHVTKRSVLSEISQIFDPLGLLSPSIITAKIIMQGLWRERISWDESLPASIYTRWVKFRNDLGMLNQIKINRHVICLNPIDIQIHGFCDSSESAYGACIYIRSENQQGEVFVHLLCAKTKVAPLKTVTIPRLELCGALLLATIVDKVRKSMNMPITSFTFWCDSTVVLGWLKTSPNLLQIFVGNRVAQIQELTDVSCWRHVPTAQNVADMLTRGVEPSVLKNLSTWWSGPSWLRKNEIEWPNLQDSNENLKTLPELRKSTHSYTGSIIEGFPFKNYSNLFKLQKIIAYCLRFKANSLKPKPERSLGLLSSEELNDSLRCLIKIAQLETFPSELKALRNKRALNSKSRLQFKSFHR